MIHYWSAPARHQAFQAYGPIVGLQLVWRRWLADWPITWGRVTGVVEPNVVPFTGHWTGTGSIDGTGDSEELVLASGQVMTSDVNYTGAQMVELLTNHYQAGDTVLLEYRTGADAAAVSAASWTTYSLPFLSANYVQLRLTSTL